MADLKPLIRYRKFALEEQQRFLSRLYQEVERLIQRKEGILTQIEKEKDLTDGDGSPDMIITFLGYVDRMRGQIALLDGEVRRVEARIDVAMDEMRDAFAELKKVEITHRRRMEERKRMLQKREDMMFAEIAEQRFVKQIRVEQGIE